MKVITLTLSLLIIWIFVLPGSAEDGTLKQLQATGQLQLRKQFIKQAGRSMFNNEMNWQNWARQVDQMQPAQILGLCQILNPQQRMLLAQQQRRMDDWIYRQWLSQQMWLQQNALGGMPFGGLPWNFRQPQVAYMPIVTWLPQGTQLNANAVVSADRRSVRMNLNPIFSSIGPVHHFNMANGAYYQPNYGYRGNGNGYSSSSRNTPAGNAATNRRSIPEWYRKIRNNP